MMWYFFAVCSSVALAHPEYFECNDPRFEAGSKIMGTTAQTVDGALQVSTNTYTHGSSVSIMFNQYTSEQSTGPLLENPSRVRKGVQIAARVLPRYGYLGDYGRFTTLSGSFTYAQGNCPNTVVSAMVEQGASLTWTAGEHTFGDVDIVLVWGNNAQLSRSQFTVSGPPVPKTPPNIAHNGNTSLQQPQMALRSGRRQQPPPGRSPSSSPSPVRVNSCVASADGSFNLPNAPVFVQKVPSKRGVTKEITFPAGQCVPCREDHLERCVSARVECPSEPGLFAIEELFMTDNCVGESTISRLPTAFVHCPGPEHYSPDNLDLERLVKKLQRDHSQYFPDEKTARAAMAEYRRMLRVMQRFPDEPAVPSKLVDLVWHEHMLDSRTYHLDSQRLFGKYMHHAPTFGDEQDLKVQAEKAEMQVQQKQMLQRYVELFQEVPDLSIWPSVPVMGAGRLPDCCQASCVKPDCVTCVGCNAIDCGKLREDRQTTAALPEHFAGYIPLSGDEQASRAPGYLCSVQPMPGMTFSWVISGEFIYMKQELQTSVAETWHGIGFTDIEPYDMGFGDFIVTMYNRNYSGLRDLYKYDAGNHYPCFDVLTQCSAEGQAGSMDILDATNSRANGFSSSTWTRLLDTEDRKDSVISQSTKKVMFAHGHNDDFTYHGIDHHVTCDLNFFSGDSSCGVFWETDTVV